MSWVARRRRETEVTVKRRGLLVFGVNRERADASDVGDLQSAAHRVREEAGAETPALHVLMNRKPREDQ